MNCALTRLLRCLGQPNSNGEPIGEDAAKGHPKNLVTSRQVSAALFGSFGCSEVHADPFQVLCSPQALAAFSRGFKQTWCMAGKNAVPEEPSSSMFCQDRPLGPAGPARTERRKAVETTVTTGGNDGRAETSIWAVVPEQAGAEQFPATRHRAKPQKLGTRLRSDA